MNGRRFCQRGLPPPLPLYILIELFVSVSFDVSPLSLSVLFILFYCSVAVDHFE